MDYILNITGHILKGVTITFQLYLVTAIFSVILGILGALGKNSKLYFFKEGPWNLYLGF